MKAAYSRLWETGREILVNAEDENERIQDISDLKKCENVLVGKKDRNMYEVLIDNSIVFVSFTTVNHPCGGKMYICEVN